jgi:hypothetical protein
MVTNNSLHTYVYYFLYTAHFLDVCFECDQKHVSTACGECTMDTRVAVFTGNCTTNKCTASHHNLGEGVLYCLSDCCEQDYVETKIDIENSILSCSLLHVKKLDDIWGYLPNAEELIRRHSLGAGFSPSQSQTNTLNTRFNPALRTWLLTNVLYQLSDTVSNRITLSELLELRRRVLDTFSGCSTPAEGIANTLSDTPSFTCESDMQTFALDSYLTQLRINLEALQQTPDFATVYAFISNTPAVAAVPRRDSMVTILTNISKTEAELRKCKKKIYDTSSAMEEIDHDVKTSTSQHEQWQKEHQKMEEDVNTQRIQLAAAEQAVSTHTQDHADRKAMLQAKIIQKEKLALEKDTYALACSEAQDKLQSLKVALDGDDCITGNIQCSMFFYVFTCGNTNWKYFNFIFLTYIHMYIYICMRLYVTYLYNLRCIL